MKKRRRGHDMVWTEEETKALVKAVTLFGRDWD